MALIFGTNNKVLFSGTMMKILGGQGATVNTTGPWGLGMTIYKGTAPTTAAIIASWASYNSTSPDYLVHYLGGSWSQPSGSGALLNMTAASYAAQLPVATGTATWAILWAGNPTPAQLSGTVLPYTSFLVVSVSDSTGDGVVRFASTSLTSGVSVAVSDGSMASNI